MPSKTFFILAIIIIVVFLGVTLFFRGGNEKPSAFGNSSGLIISDNAIYVAEQVPSYIVSVSVVRLKKSGFVVIHEDAAGEPGEILGVSNLLPQGETENPQPITLSRTMRDSETVYAMLHFDNGDGKFDATNDKPVLDSVSNAPMMMVVIISKDATGPGTINP